MGGNVVRTVEFVGGPLDGEQMPIPNEATWYAYPLTVTLPKLVGETSMPSAGHYVMYHMDTENRDRFLVE